MRRPWSLIIVAASITWAGAFNSAVALADDPEGDQVVDAAEADEIAEYEAALAEAEMEDDVQVFIGRGGRTVNDEALGYANRRRWLIASVCELSEEQQSKLAELDKSGFEKRLARPRNKLVRGQTSPTSLRCFLGRVRSREKENSLS